MNVNLLKAFLLISALLLSGCDKDNGGEVSQNDLETTVPVSTSEPEINLSTTLVEPEPDVVVADAPVNPPVHNTPVVADPLVNENPSTTLDETPLPDFTEVSSQCGVNGDFFQGLESSSDCIDAVDDEEKEEATITSAPASNDTGIAFCYFNKSTIRGSYLKTSKWGPIGNVQRAMKIKIDGIFGADTKASLLSTFKLPSLDCLKNNQYTQLTKQKPETYKQKAANFSYMMEGTDYDTLEFNYGHDDIDPSGATWGPTGMTLLSGEISEIFALALKSDELLSVLSTEEATILKQLSTESS